MKRKAGSGRKRITTLAQDRALKYRSKRNRSATAVELQCEVKHKNGKDQVSVETVRRRLREAGLYGRIARRKPLLTAKHIEKRLEWAKKYEKWTATDWEKVVFSDESGFPLFAKFSRAFVRRGPGEAFLPQCIKPTVKHGGGKVMVWGCFSILGPGVIKRVEGKMTKEVYHGILTHHYVPHIRKLTKDHPQPQGHWMLQQDNDPKHTKPRSTRHT